jgi:1-phosphatidylinositol-4-phosphate 5-kinase
MLKTISNDEYFKLRDILPEYYHHLEQNKNSILTRFYGLHKITYKNQETGKVHKTPIVIMNNLFVQYPIEDRYDLKGSTEGRGTPGLYDDGRNKKLALKDLDFQQIQRVIVLEDSPKNKDLK